MERAASGLKRKTVSLLWSALPRQREPWEITAGSEGGRQHTFGFFEVGDLILNRKEVWV